MDGSSVLSSGKLVPSPTGATLSVPRLVCGTGRPLQAVGSSNIAICRQDAAGRTGLARAAPLGVARGQLCCNRPINHQRRVRGRNRYLSTCVIRTEHQSNDNRGHRASTAQHRVEHRASTARAPRSTARAASGAPPARAPPGAPRATPSVANCLKRLGHPNGRPRTFSQRVKAHDVHSFTQLQRAERALLAPSVAGCCNCRRPTTASRCRKLRWRERNPCSTCVRCCRTGGTMCWRGRCATKPCQAACARRHRACATALASSRAKTYLLGLWRRSTQSTRSALAAPAWSWNLTMASAASDWRARRTGWRFGTSRSRTGAPSKCGSTPTRRVASTAGSAILPTTPPPPRRRWVPAPRRRNSRGTMKKPRPPATW